MREYEVLVCYNRECNLDRDYHKILRVMAESEDKAFNLVDSYGVNGMFDDIEMDYIEDSMYAIRIL